MTRPRVLRRLAATALGAILLASAPVWTDARRPRLIVLLVIDQMRADYLDRFQHQWSAGLRRLIDHGAWFRQAFYPYLNTITCAGHATLATGAYPPTHGIILNTFWDRDAQRTTTCADDPAAPFVSFADDLPGGASPRRLQVPTLADEMRAQLPVPPRVAAFTGKGRSAIMMAGRRGDAVVWFEARAKGWVTSRAYADRRQPWLEAFVRANPVERDFGRLWTKIAGDDVYLYGDNPVGRTPRPGSGTVLPHPIRGESGAADESFYDLWADSPFVDDLLERFAGEALVHLRLGQGPGTDFLAVSFSALDRIGHTYGPLSHEVQDGLMRLDAVLGRLLERLDRLVGPDQYVLALSADHGVAPIPEQMRALGFDAGRVPTRAVRDRVDRMLREIWGEGQYAAAFQNTQFYFRPGVYERLTADPPVLAKVLRLIAESPGVERVYRIEELIGGARSNDPLLRMAAASTYPPLSGDLTVVPKPYWITSAEAATHGTGYRYDAHVPVILMGTGIRPGEYLEPVSPADIAPTLAFLAGVTLARADGRVLREAIAPAPVPPPAATGQPNQPQALSSAGLPPTRWAPATSFP